MRYFTPAGYVVTLSTLLIGACGEDPLNPDVTGIVNAVVHDDPQDGHGKRASSFSGTAAGNMFVSLRSTGGTWINVGSPNGITVNLQSQAATTVHGPTSVPAGEYDRVRLTLSNVEVTVKGGGAIGRISLQSDVKATLAADSPFSVERSVSDFPVDEAGTTLVRFDLNAEIWLDEEALFNGT
ncbi:MAG TPA: hypothetical protein VJB15_07860, partial [Rhodothermia bacterium]|nr:hypothetical protein [Rhodothermia bacterium]